MAEETLDPSVIEQTRQQIKRLVGEIAELAEADIQPQEFAVEFLNRVVAAVAATGGALWMVDPRGGLRIQHQIEFRQTGLLDGRVRSAPHDALLGVMMQTNEPQSIPSGAVVEGMPNAGNPTPFTLIIAPITVDKQNVGLIEILMDPSRKAAQQRSTLVFVSDLADLATQYLKNRQMRQVLSQQRLWNQLEGFTHSIHNSLGLTETALAVANEGKRLVGCDRVSVAVKIGGRPLVEAISGQEVVERRSNLVRELTRLCKVVVASGEDLVYTGDTENFPPDIRDALELYIDESGSKALFVTLLHKPISTFDKEGLKAPDRVPFGCIVAEQIGDEMPMTDAQARAEVVARHASTALWNAQTHDKIFLRGLLTTIGGPSRWFRGRNLAKILAVLGLIGCLVATLAFVPWRLTIAGKGSLLPAERYSTFAPVAQGAVVEKVFVEHGQTVKKGEPLLELFSPDLDKEHKRLIAEMNASNTQMLNLRKQYDAAVSRPQEREQLNAQLNEARIKHDSALEQIDIINEQIQTLTLTSPCDGIVTTWEVQKNLMRRPVEVGQELIQVADTSGDWVLEVEVADSDMGPILTAYDKLKKEIAAGTKPADARLGAYFVTMTDPEHRYRGQVLRISARAETAEQEHVVKVTVAFPEDVRQDFLRRNREMRPGSEVRARVECGDASLAYVIFRDVIQVFYETVMFRWPFLKS